MNDLLNCIADMVIEEYSTGDYGNGELISVKILDYKEDAVKLWSRLLSEGYESVIHNVDGNIGVEITSDEV